jgi:hypothetical protein
MFKLGILSLVTLVSIGAGAQSARRVDSRNPVRPMERIMEVVYNEGIPGKTTGYAVLENGETYLLDQKLNTRKDRLVATVNQPLVLSLDELMYQIRHQELSPDRQENCDPYETVVYRVNSPAEKPPYNWVTLYKRQHCAEYFNRSNPRVVMKLKGIMDGMNELATLQWPNDREAATLRRLRNRDGRIQK